MSDRKPTHADSQGRSVPTRDGSLIPHEQVHRYTPAAAALRSGRVLDLGGSRFGAAGRARPARRWRDPLSPPSRRLMHEIVACGWPADGVICWDYVSPFNAVRRRSNLSQFARRFAFAGSVMGHMGMYVLRADSDEDQVAERVGIYERLRWERGGRALADG